MKYMIGDLLLIQKGIIAHQTNLYGVMGAGIASYLSKQYPLLESAYSDYCFDGLAKLGDVFSFPVNGFRYDFKLGAFKPDPNTELIIANCFSQKKVCLKCAEGKNISKGIPVMDSKIEPLTEYNALKTCFDIIYLNNPTATLYVPFLYGCGIAGGDWEIVKKIFEKYPGNLNVVCRPSDLQKYAQDSYLANKDPDIIAEIETIYATAEDLRYE